MSLLLLYSVRMHPEDIGEFTLIGFFFDNLNTLASAEINWPYHFRVELLVGNAQFASPDESLGI